MANPDKRETLKIIGTISLQCAFPFQGDELWGQHVHVPPGKAAELPKPSYFGAEDLAVLARLADLILPGAAAAGVPAYIDLVVAKNPEHKRNYAAGLQWLKAKTFMALDEAAQLALLEPVCAAVDRGEVTTPEQKFFRAAKNMTADGFFTSRAGLMDYLGYQGNQVLAEFPECTINEH
jgi:hypothetical protein